VDVAVSDLEALADTFEDAKFVVLLRNGEDAIFSLLEATPFTAGGLGLELYSRRYPLSRLRACATLWVECMEKVLALEQRHPQRCERVHYEDLVSEPEKTLRQLCEFLDVPWSAALLDVDGALRNGTRQEDDDYKVWEECSFSTRSIGRGRHLPLADLPSELRERMQLAQARCEKPSHLRDSTKRTLDGRVWPSLITGGIGVRIVGSQREDASAAVASLRLEVGELLRSRIANRLNDQGLVVHGEPFDREISLEVEEDPFPFVVNFATGGLSRSRASGCARVITDAETILGIAKGTCHPAVARMHRRMRVCGADGRQVTDPDAERAVISLLRPKEELP
jgi:hypothetical protein